MSESRTASQIVTELRGLNSKAHELACAVSLASRIEPELLRRARLHAIDGADASAEADVWLSDAMQSRNALFAVMRADVAHELRSQLTQQQSLLSRAWSVIDEAHRNAPPSIRVEEEITWRSLVDPEDPEVQKLFTSVLAGLKESRPGLARWVARVLPRMPEQALELAVAQRVRLRASSLLGGYPILGESRSRAALSEIATELQTSGAKPIEIGIRLFETSMRISEPPELHTQRIEIPRTEPLVLEISWRKDEKGNAERRLVSFSAGSTQTLDIGPGILSVRTAAGDAYTLTPLAARQLSGYTSVATADGLTLRLYRGESRVMLAFDLEQSQTASLLGFAVTRLGPDGKVLRLEAPLGQTMQRFRWIDRTRPGPHTYYLSKVIGTRTGELEQGTVSADIDVEPSWQTVSVGHTRGPSSQELARRMGIAELRSHGFRDGTTSTETLRAYQNELRFFGGRAQVVIEEFLRSAIRDEDSTVDLVTDQLDHRGLIELLAQLGRRLFLVVPDKVGVEARRYLTGQGCDVSSSRHLRAFSGMVAVKYVQTRPVAALLGSSSFGVQAICGSKSYVIKLESPDAAQSLTRFTREMAQGRKPDGDQVVIHESGLPPVTLLRTPGAINRLAADIVGRARSSILFCLPSDVEEGIMDALQTRDPGLPFAGGVFHDATGSSVVWGPTKSTTTRLDGSVITPPRGSFIVVDFNQPDASVLAGAASFMFARGDSPEAAAWLRDPALATSFALEVLSLIDSMRFRVLTKQGGRLLLKSDSSWARRYYTGVGAIERSVFAATPEQIQQQQQESAPPKQQTASRKQQTRKPTPRRPPAVKRAAAKKVSPRRKGIRK